MEEFIQGVVFGGNFFINFFNKIRFIL